MTALIRIEGLSDVNMLAERRDNATVMVKDPEHSKD